MASDMPVGLDIGAMSIRAVEVGRAREGLVVSHFGQVPLPYGAVRSGVVQDQPMVTAALKKLWAQAKFRSRDVVLGVSNPQVVVREMSVTNLPARELKQSLPFQVRDSLPLPVERSLLDFYPLEDAGERKTVRGLLIAAPKDAVMTAVKAAEKAGLLVARVDLASFALLRAASRLDSYAEALVDIGAQATTVVVHVNGEPRIVRTVPRGGAEVTEAISNRFGVSLADAETLKCRVGLQLHEGPEVAELIRDSLRPLVNEIRSSFTYLSSGEQATDVRRVSLTGGGSNLAGMVEMLRVQLEMDVVLADPVMRLHRPGRGRHDQLDRARSSAAVSIGLSLGAAA
ncbi:pilus assembly protein PilM [Pilimelia anulata]|uniref:Pilus assembly protein PilM n=1 Tax=Pilimelia anulata TaxID=53371 RepID=A0A8J3AZB9_9ACTN|nr:type IV pilus assembly protein PilM [Pilimelia anulata]GGJ76127.1 pilus assembly protein PilM [Pilimelia anulata]